MRLLPIRGSDVAANWAAHQLHELKRASATFGYQLDPAVVEFRDRLLEWQRHPSRTRKQFQNDLVRWRSQRQEPEQVAVEEQDAWVAEQHHERYQSAATIDTDAARTPTRRRRRRSTTRAPRRRSTSARRARPTGAAQIHQSSNIDTGTARLWRVWRNRASMRSAIVGIDLLALEVRVDVVVLQAEVRLVGLARVPVEQIGGRHLQVAGARALRGASAARGPAAW